MFVLLLLFCLFVFTRFYWRFMFIFIKIQLILGNIKRVFVCVCVCVCVRECVRGWGWGRGLYLCLCACMCVCAWEREKERQTDRQRFYTYDCFADARIKTPLLYVCFKRISVAVRRRDEVGGCGFVQSLFTAQQQRGRSVRNVQMLDWTICPLSMPFNRLVLYLRAFAGQPVWSCLCVKNKTTSRLDINFDEGTGSLPEPLRSARLECV